MNKFDLLMELILELINEGYKISNYALLDIKHERKDREIKLIDNDFFDLYYHNEQLHLSTKGSNQIINNIFVKNLLCLNTIKDQFNSIE